jgi:hypothetical protein
MTRDDIIRLAREAGVPMERGIISGITYCRFHPAIERFAALVAATEREACAKVCEDIPLPKNPPELTHLPTIERCADAIRARGQ